MAQSSAAAADFCSGKGIGDTDCKCRITREELFERQDVAYRRKAAAMAAYEEKHQNLKGFVFFDEESQQHWIDSKCSCDHDFGLHRSERDAPPNLLARVNELSIKLETLGRGSSDSKSRKSQPQSQLRQYLSVRDNAVCVLTGTKCSEFMPWHAAHIVPYELLATPSVDTVRAMLKISKEEMAILVANRDMPMNAITLAHAVHRHFDRGFVDVDPVTGEIIVLKELEGVTFNKKVEFPRAKPGLALPVMEYFGYKKTLRTAISSKNGLAVCEKCQVTRFKVDMECHRLKGICNQHIERVSESHDSSVAASPCPTSITESVDVGCPQ
eukprot:GDKH01023794.1.p1 GENE.GDKH01023794.1~~GDKH01023794.1.p1  ORF type:complete len:326 (+),score=19.93 GDKH01023794.1:176-1153(+)